MATRASRRRSLSTQNELSILIGRGKFLSTLIELDVDGKKVRVIPREVQVDPVKDMPVHVDFQRVGPGASIRVNVPVRFVNEALSPGLKRGGVLNIVRHEVEVMAPADKIPEFFEFNLEGLEIGRSIHISAVKMPDGVRPTIQNRDFTVATVAGHKIEEEPTPAAAVATAEGAAAVPGCRGRRTGCRRGRSQGGRRRGQGASRGGRRQAGCRGEAGCSGKTRRRQEIVAAGRFAARRSRVGSHGRLPMKLFVGLGNPGSAYARHRHNVGFMALDRIAERHGLGPWKKRFHGLVSDGPIGGRRVMLLKPQTYMNDSGQAVGEAQRYLKIAEEDIYRLPRRDRPGAGQAESEGRRRQCRPQRPALDLRAHRQRIRARAHRRRASGLQGSGQHYVLHDFAKADADWLEPHARCHGRRCGPPGRR